VKNKTTYRLLRTFLLVGVGLLSGGSVLAYEEPQYTVVTTYDDFELRQYEPYVVAEIRTTGDFDEIGNQAFRKLFRFISEDDRPQGKISMTVPVIQQPLPEESDQKSYRFAFVMPAAYKLEDLPKPDDATIEIKNIPARLLVARRYSGTWSQERYRKNEKILTEATIKAGLTPVGKPIFARYNAPFSLWFLRRNEVLIEVVPP
jgi:DNA gyrase inhibitor GyrI